MKSRTYQEFYDYVFGDRADIEGLIAKRKAEHMRHKTGDIIEDEKLQTLQAELTDKCQKFFDFIPRPDRFKDVLHALNAGKLIKILFSEDMPGSSTLNSSYLFPADETIKHLFHVYEAEYHFFTVDEQEHAFQQYLIFFKLAKIIADIVERNNTSNDGVAYAHAYKMLILFGEKSPAKKKSTSRKEVKAEAKSDKVVEIKTDAETTSDVVAKDKPESPIQFINLFKHLDAFIKLHSLFEKDAPLHDALIFSLPKNDPGKITIHLEDWRKIIRAGGMRACRIFGRAKEIEERLSGHPPKNFTEALEQARLIVYKKSAENPELADLCMFYDVKEETFNRCLFIDEKRKKSDDLPDITIDGNDVGHPGYYLVKLPIEDPRAYVLGQMTDCCQFIGGHSEKCTIDGVTRKSNGFYVLLKEKKKQKPSAKEITKAAETKTTESKHQSSPFKSSTSPKKINYADFEIIGQGYAWLSTQENLTFDSWENLRPEADDKIIFDLLTKFSRDIVEAKDSTIFRVTIGTGGKTPDDFENNGEAVVAERMREGHEYGDAGDQYEVYCNAERQMQLLQELLMSVSKLKIKDDLLKTLKPHYITSATVVNEIKVLCNDADITDMLANIEIQKAMSSFANKDEVFYSLLKDFAILHRRDLLTETSAHILFFFYRYPDERYKEVNEILMWLASRKILNQENFDVLMRSGRYSGVRGCLKKLEVSYDLLRSENLLDYIHYAFSDAWSSMARYSQSIAEGIIILKNAGLLDRDNLKMILLRRELVKECASILNLFNKQPDEIEFSADQKKMLIDTLDSAAKFHHLPLVSLLLEKGKLDLNESLLAVIPAGSVAIVKALLAKKADVNFYKRVSTPLLLASHLRHENAEEIIALLLEAKADPNPEVNLNYDYTPLHFACGWPQNGRDNIVKMLLDAKANVAAIHRSGSTPLVDACKSLGYPDSDPTKIIAMLLEAKSSPNCRKGPTPLSFAVKYGHVGSIAALIRHENLIIKKDAEMYSSSNFDAYYVPSRITECYRPSYIAALAILQEEKLLTPENSFKIARQMTVEDFKNSIDFLKEAKLLNNENLNAMIDFAGGDNSHKNVVQLKEIKSEDILWLTNQIEKINSAGEKLPQRAMDAIEKIFLTEKLADILKFYLVVKKMCALLSYEELKSAPADSGSAFFQKPDQPKLGDKVYTLLLAIEKHCCHLSLDLPAKKFSAIEEPLFDKVPESKAVKSPS